MSSKYFSVCLMISALSAPVFAEKSLEAQGCRPVPDMAMSQFIIGYGSLMQEQSKQEDSANVGKNLPIYITGFDRGWIEHSTEPRFGTTYLGVKSKPNHKMNAVYFKLNAADDIHNYDKRENTYCRVAVSKDKIQSLGGIDLPEGQYWIYTTVSKGDKPSKQFPLVQSYVDIFLSGCLDLEKQYHLQGFAKDCVNTTSNWSPAWKNDRVNPRTAVDNVAYVADVDSLIANTLPEYYNQIKIE